MSINPSFDELMRGVRAGDDAAESALFARYVRRLIGLAASRFDAKLRHRADVEVVVMSAYKSFFLRNRRGEFEVDDFGAIWAVLAMITLQKCSDRIRYLRAARRDYSRAVEWPDYAESLSCLRDRDLSPHDRAAVTETIEMLLGTMTLQDRPIVEHILLGYTEREIADRLGCSERTVERVRPRARRRLERLAFIDSESMCRQNTR